MRLFLTFILAGFVAGCEISYVSTIYVDRTKVNTPGADDMKESLLVEKVIKDYCSHKNFLMQDVHYDKQELSKKEKEFVLQCGKMWFYNIRSFRRQDTYEIELFLMQPGPYRVHTKFFCNETKEFNNYFQEKLGSEPIALRPYSGCK